MNSRRLMGSPSSKTTRYHIVDECGILWLPMVEMGQRRSSRVVRDMSAHTPRAAQKADIPSLRICAISSLRFYFNNRTASSFERDRQNELEKRPALVRRHGNFTAVLLNNDTANS
jgi:hypothetical protein